MFSSLNNIKQIQIGDKDITILWKFKLQLNNNLIGEEIII